MPSRSSAASAPSSSEELGIDPSPALVELERADPRPGPRPARRGGRGRAAARLPTRRAARHRAGRHRACRAAARRRPRARREDAAARDRRRPGVHPHLRGHRAPGGVAAPPGRRTDPRLVARTRRRLRGDAAPARRDAARPAAALAARGIARSSRWSSASAGRSRLAAATGSCMAGSRPTTCCTTAPGEPVLTDFWLGGPAAPAPEDDVRAFAALVGQALAGSDVSPEVAGVARVTGRDDGRGADRRRC